MDVLAAASAKFLRLLLLLLLLVLLLPLCSAGAQKKHTTAVQQVGLQKSVCTAATVRPAGDRGRGWEHVQVPCTRQWS